MASAVLAISLVTIAMSLAALAAGLVLRSVRESAVEKGRTQGAAAGCAAGQMARRMLEGAGCAAVVSCHGGQDEYDAAGNMLLLSNKTHDGTDAASAFLACHEAGHALQLAKRPRAAAGLSAIRAVRAILLVLWAAGLVMAVVYASWAPAIFGCACWAAALVCSLLRCAVEHDASARALAFLKEQGLGASSLRTAHNVATLSLASYACAIL